MLLWNIWLKFKSNYVACEHYNWFDFKFLRHDGYDKGQIYSKIHTINKFIRKRKIFYRYLFTYDIV